MEGINQKIIQLIKDYDTNTWGLKSDEFIMNYCSFYPLLLEAVCNRGLDLDVINNIEEYLELSE